MTKAELLDAKFRHQAAKTDYSHLPTVHLAVDLIPALLEEIETLKEAMLNMARDLKAKDDEIERLINEKPTDC